MLEMLSYVRGIRVKCWVELKLLSHPKKMACNKRSYIAFLLFFINILWLIDLFGSWTKQNNLNIRPRPVLTLSQATPCPQTGTGVSLVAGWCVSWWYTWTGPLISQRATQTSSCRCPWCLTRGPSPKSPDQPHTAITTVTSATRR